MSIPVHALGFFTAKMARWFELAEREPSLTEVLFDGATGTVVDIAGELQPMPDSDLDDSAVMSLALQAAVFSDQVFNREHPFLSIIIPPDWRCSFARPPIVQQPIMALRKLRRIPIPLARYVETGVMTWEQKLQLEELVVERKTIIVSGSVGSGKTTLLRALLGLIDRSERIVVLEDPRELMLTAEDGFSPRQHYVALEATRGVMELDALLRASLRLRPDRIICGEVRGPEALELVRALNTGFSGAMWTLHSNGAREALDRLHTLVLEAQASFRFESTERAIDAVVQISGRGQSRRIDEIWLNPSSSHRD